MKLLDVPGHKDLKRHPITGRIYVRMHRGNKGELCKSTKTKNIREAREIADSYIQTFFGTKAKSKEVKLIGDLWPSWVETKEDLSRGTADSIKYSAARLIPFWGPLLPSEITSMQWERYLQNIRANSPETRFFNDRKWFRSFILWMHENGMIERCPKLRNPDPTKSDAGRYLTSEEFKKLLHEAHPELQLQMLMAYTMGMRINEILKLTWGADKQNTSFVDLEKKIIHLHKKDTKIRKSRTFGISEIVYGELVLKHKATKSEWLWPSLSDPTKPIGRQGNKTAWNNARKKAGIKCRFHDLRHTFLTNAFKAGEGKIDSLLICDYAGLDITQAQKTYLHFSYEDTRAVSSLIIL